ncbi:hypothetical protein AMTRI_Chr13g88190 [Amborella trichopoda]
MCACMYVCTLLPSSSPYLYPYGSILACSNLFPQLQNPSFFGCRYAITKAFCIAFVMTFFEVFDVPVFWPILLFYWLVLFVLTMKRQIRHMIKYRYVPFSFGKQRYTGKNVASNDKELAEDLDDSNESSA